MLQPEQILDQRYKLKQKLSQAPGRQTWLAEDISLQPPELVVVKLLAFGAGTTQWEDLKLFEREAQVLRQLDHPQIPKYRESFSISEPQQWFGLVQDYIPGQSLKQLLEQGKHFRERQVLQIAVNLLHLLIYLHELSPPVLHRDIKPSNLIWGKDNFIYLVDFGAVQNRAAREGTTFTVVGTYGYAPLEQFGGRAVPASDLYGLGATLIHLLTGVCPAELPQKDLRIQFADRVSLNPSFVRWIEKLVEPDVSKRFQTARQALEALRSPTAELLDPNQKALTAGEAQSLKRALAENEMRSLQPPLDTRLEVYQTPDELIIKIPGSSSWELLLLLPPLGIVLVALGQVLLPSTLTVDLGMLVLFLGIVGSVVSFTYWNFLPTIVRFDRQQFSISKQLFGRKVSLVSGSTTTVQEITATQKNFHSGSNAQAEWVVMLSAPSGAEFFGRGLSQAECGWLVDVIQQWLD
ncbi:serine/threonine protein kinase [Leptodesmis sp.]|uniref:serine/threonine protein kinase n=1 Tax=Leptodesmis sp. TaxID=3100501 RepID=UPI0040534FE0